MSRSRNIKPGFFKNEHLAELPPLTRLLFEALWCEADRTGRLEDRPARIKAEYFPYDDYDVNTGLAQLLNSAGKFITRYEVNGERYIQVNNFLKHQNPHRDEKPRGYPSPSEAHEIIDEKEKHSTSTVLAPCKHHSCLVLAGLIPDSFNLIPDSLTTDSPVVRMKQSEIEKLYRECFSRLQPTGGERQILIEFCEKYTPEAITAAFNEAKGARAQTLNYLRKVFENKDPPVQVDPDCEFMQEQRRLYGD